MIPPTLIKRKPEDVPPGNAVVAGIFSHGGIRLALSVYMVIRLVSLDCTIYLLGVAECLLLKLKLAV